MKSGIKSAIVWKKDLIVNLYTMKNISKLKWDFYEGKISTNFDSDKVPKEGSEYICLSVILIDSVLRKGKYYYPQAFLEERRYIVKEKRSLNILLTTKKFLLMKENMMKKKKFWWRELYRRINSASWQKFCEFLFWGSYFKNAFF